MKSYWAGIQLGLYQDSGHLCHTLSLSFPIWEVGDFRPPTSLSHPNQNLPKVRGSIRGIRHG